MTENFDFLKNPFEGLTNENKKEFQNKCSEIAENLFNNFCIQCGENGEEKYYKFAEIEFYYYNKENLNQKWNEKTYPRTNKDAGDLFFHYSGVDICFDSKFDNGIFGGILIRSLKDNQGKYITGPSVCMLEILNACSKSERMPKLVSPKKEKCEIGGPIERYGIEQKDDLPLCFYDKNLFEKYTSKDNYKETFENATWDYAKKSPKKIIRYYKRFCK